MKTLTKHISEKLIINKNFIGCNHLDELIDNEIDFNEGEKITTGNLSEYLWISMQLNNVLNLCAYKIRNKSARNSIIKDILNVVNFDDSYIFEYGPLKPRNQRPNSKSLRAFVGKNFELIHPEHTPSGMNDSDINDIERILLYDNDSFWVYYDIGRKYTFVLIGSSEDTRAIISKNKQS